MDVSPAEMGGYGTCKAKMDPDMASIRKPIRLALLLPERVRNFAGGNSAVGICR